VNLILIESADINPDGAARVGGSQAEHIKKVLKSSPGHELRVGVIDGPSGDATITAVSDSYVDLACRLDPEPPPRPGVDLLLALPRPKVLRRLWAQLAALGVGRIILTNAERVERDYFDTHILQPETYRPLLIEGLQQARDTRLPQVSIHKRFKVLIEDELEDLCPQRHRLVAHPEIGVGKYFEILPDPYFRTVLAIGPEGGWNGFELELLESKGFERISLGPRPLRTDTATIAMLALVHSVRSGMSVRP
jgi:16S rRNA (uracil1498-N3)-methyltransferase